MGNGFIFILSSYTAAPSLCHRTLLDSNLINDNRNRSDYSFSKVKNLAKFKEITVPKIRLVTYQLINVTIIIDFPSTAAGDDECRSHTPITMRVDPCSTIGDIIADINSIRNIEINPSNQSATGLFLGLELKGRRLGDNSELRGTSTLIQSNSLIKIMSTPYPHLHLSASAPTLTFIYSFSFHRIFWGDGWKRISLKILRNCIYTRKTSRSNHRTTLNR